MRRRDVDIINTILLILVVASILILAGAVNIFRKEGYSAITLGYAIGGVLIAILSQTIRTIYNRSKNKSKEDNIKD